MYSRTASIRKWVAGSWFRRKAHSAKPAVKARSKRGSAETLANHSASADAKNCILGCRVFDMGYFVGVVGFKACWELVRMISAWVVASLAAISARNFLSFRSWSCWNDSSR